LGCSEDHAEMLRKSSAKGVYLYVYRYIYI